MLFSLALILFCGFALGGAFGKLKLPPLLGMMLAGVVLGPHALNLLAPTLLGISAELRQICLIVILLRAGLSLKLDDLKKVGRPAVLMCFLPATFELAAVMVLAPIFLHVTYLEAAIMGAVLAAVSPAVVVPRMLHLLEQGYGKNKSIPQLVLAGAAVDDVYVIVLFASFTGMYQGRGFDARSLAAVPVSILLGLALGLLVGVTAARFWGSIPARGTVTALLFLGLGFLFVCLEEAAKPVVPLSGLLAVMAMGVAVRKRCDGLANRLSGHYANVWVAAELLLFVLVGAAVDLSYIRYAGLSAICLILFALLLRTAGVFLCLLGTRLNWGERLFVAFSYLPKATVQAAIGGIPLALGVPAGNRILTVAVLAIALTAPLGAILIDHTYKKLLREDR